METKMIWANLVSHDLQRTVRFYTDLGFKPNGKGNDELVSFLFGETNFVIHFFTPKRFENAIKSKSSDTKAGNEIIFSLSASSREAVDGWFEKVKQAGGEIFAQPENFDLGYTFGFADPDGHKFNFLYWPGM
ncbi:VOC family protein [Flavobacterium humi]|uniref:Glyoxalase n=1 Tax=Flavobacterium humi TaxID=2562683 RepID=A0A4Z0LDB1_9FLAO|nr:VOC family protein [Flavobacterium humi]TGD59878.1 glyoxalase [Flavobacterium humi]